MGPLSFPKISIIINTDGRRDSLKETIEAFRWVDYPHFELCVVCGPTPDGTRELVLEYESEKLIKVKFCPERNLSQSRNIGIAMAAGEIVAFIDDDGIPEPEWLAQLSLAFASPGVKAAGGKVFDHTGARYQYLYAACDRLGNAIIDLKAPVGDASFPLSDVFPYVQGTNSAFVREALVQIGGFDEEYEFYLDETDVCCRMVDAGHSIAQLNNAAVHHKYMPSSIRNSDRITTSKFAIIKNKIYFSIVNNLGHYPFARVMDDALRFAQQQRSDLEYHVAGGRLRPEILEQFDEDLERALRMGVARGLSGSRRTRPASYFENSEPFRPYMPLRAPELRRTFVFLSQNYPPAHMDGIAKYTQDIARAVAARGHTVHVLARGKDYARVDLEDGVWVHRLVDKECPRLVLPTGEEVPQNISNHAQTILEEIERISSFRKVDVVEASSWDCEAIALLLDGRYPVVTNIVTTLQHWLDTHDEYLEDLNWMTSFGQPMIAAEKQLFDKSDLVISASGAIATAITERYGSVLDKRTAFIPHGMSDMARLPRSRPTKFRESVPGSINILFLGRLELRKGIDVLLDCVPDIVNAHPNVQFWIAGDNTIPIAGTHTAMQRFLQSRDSSATLENIQFLGRVSDDELRWLYANCDIYTSPSRFESFGIIFVEAMMFSKPSVGTDNSGIAEIVEHDVTGLLTRAGNVDDLKEALLRLVGDAGLRARLGAAGRQVFEARFESGAVAEGRVRALSSVAREQIDERQLRQAPGVREIVVGLGQSGFLIPDGSGIELAVGAAGVIYVTFWVHAWSGIAGLTVDGVLLSSVDLYHPSGAYRTVRLDLGTQRDNVTLGILRSGRKSAQATNSEVIIHSVQKK